MNKRILYVSNHLRGPGGAAGTRSWQQANVLSETWNVTVVLPKTDPVTTQAVTSETYAGLDLGSVDVRPVRSITLDRSREWKRVLFYIVGAMGQFWAGLKTRNVACVLAMSLPIKSLLVATILAFFKRVPLVVDVRDLAFETAIEMRYLRNGTLSRFALTTEIICLRRAKMILTNSPHYKPMLEARGIEAGRIIVAPIGFDDFETSSNAEIAKSRLEVLSHFTATTPSIFGDQATEWLWTYNNERPNMGIGGMTPAMKMKTAA